MSCYDVLTGAPSLRKEFEMYVEKRESTIAVHLWAIFRTLSAHMRGNLRYKQTKICADMLPEIFGGMCVHTSAIRIQCVKKRATK